MGNCAQCKYWGSPTSDTNENFSRNIRVCQMISKEDDKYADFTSDKAHTQDSEGFHSWLETRGDFGCVEFKER